MITLKDFVNETLTQVVEGLSEFEKTQSETGYTTRPKLDLRGDLAGTAISNAGMLYLGSDVGYASVVKFDVAVTTEESENAKAGGGIRVLAFKAEGGLESSTGNSSISRVQFSIPLQLNVKKTG